jgi:hypothetical protein
MGKIRKNLSEIRGAIYVPHSKGIIGSVNGWYLGAI